jgi:hypothetical protein
MQHVILSVDFEGSHAHIIRKSDGTHEILMQDQVIQHRDLSFAMGLAYIHLRGFYHHFKFKSLRFRVWPRVIKKYRLAIAMGTHPRLGQNSPLRHFDSDAFRRILSLLPAVPL